MFGSISQHDDDDVDISPFPTRTTASAHRHRRTSASSPPDDTLSPIPEGQYFLVSSPSPEISVWSLGHGPLTLTRSKRMERSYHYGTCVVADRYAVCGRPVQIWDLETDEVSQIELTEGQLSRSVNRLGEIYPVPSFLSVDTAFAGVSQSGPAYLFTADDGGRELSSLTGTDTEAAAVVSDVRYMEETHSLYFAHDNGEVRGWSLENGEVLRIGNAGRGQITGLAVDEERLMVYAGCRYNKTFYGFSLHGDAPSQQFQVTESQGPKRGIIDLVFHPPSQQLFLLDSTHICAYDVRRVETPCACFQVHDKGTSTWPSEICQVNEEVFVSVNSTREISAWSIYGKKIGSGLHDSAGSPYSVSSPFRSQQDGRFRECESKDEVDRISFAVDFLSFGKVVIRTCSAADLQCLGAMLRVFYE